jgi:hypothetical protein
MGLSVPPAPAAHAAGHLKAHSFDFLADLLVPHAAQYSSAKLFAAFAGHIPTSAYNAFYLWMLFVPLSSMLTI